LFVGWFWFVGVLVPFIGLVQMGAQAMADRFMYVPILGLLILAIWGAAELTSRWPHRRTALAIVGTTALATCGLATHFQVKYWKDGFTLFSHAIAVTRNNALAECNLGNALGAQGHPKEAIGHFQEALRLSPAYAEAHVNFGVALGMEGKIDEAIEHYRAAIQSRPGYAQAHRFLAGALAVEHKNNEAKQEFQEALRLKPDYPEAHTRLGNLLVQQGENEEGLRHLFAAVILRDDCEDGHYYLAGALARLGRVQEAAIHFRAALRVQPDHTAALNDLAWILTTEHDPRVRNVPEAIRLGTRACELSAHTNAAYLDTLGTAFSEADRWPEAIEATEKAAAIAAASGHERLASQIQNHLQLYRAKLAHQPLPQENAH
jgi:tetratricopeptide (TPR) repeat protein